MAALKDAALNTFLQQEKNKTLPSAWYPTWDVRRWQSDKINAGGVENWTVIFRFVFPDWGIWFQTCCAILKSSDNNICCSRGKSGIQPAGAQMLVVMRLAVGDDPQHPCCHDQGGQGVQCWGSVDLQRHEQCYCFSLASRNIIKHHSSMFGHVYKYVRGKVLNLLLKVFNDLLLTPVTLPL